MTPLSPEEVNERVARKLGVEICTSDNCPGPYAGIYSCESAIRDYSRRIEAAWEIVEKLKRTGYSFNVGLYANRYWQCSISSYGNEEPDAEVAMCDTAPRAICLSFLKL